MKRTFLFFQRLLDLIAPRCCSICGGKLSVEEKLFCATCNLHLPRTYFWQDPYDNSLAQLFWVQLPVQRAAALMFYQPHSQTGSFIYDLKYHNRPEIGRMVGRQMAEEMAADHFFEGIDAIVPVPLARKRQRQRGYNQSMEIARGVSSVTHIPILHKAVTRKSFRGSQTQMSHHERQANVMGAFKLKHPEQVSGKHILMIDDIVTTGATVIACGQELVKAGGVQISILSIGFTKA
jgi:ComF family protein